MVFAGLGFRRENAWPVHAQLPEFEVGFYAASKLGAVVCPLNSLIASERSSTS
jgi:hypothetical protein